MVGQGDAVETLTLLQPTHTVYATTPLLPQGLQPISMDDGRVDESYHIRALQLYYQLTT
jgi:hypothetical protein